MEEFSSSEQAYLDKLQKLMSTPNASPYIRRKDPRREQEPGPSDLLGGSMPLNSWVQSAPTPVAPSHEHNPPLDPEGGRIRKGANGVYEMSLDIPAADMAWLEEQLRTEPAPPPHRAPERPAPASPPPPPPPRGTVAEAPAAEPPKPEGLFERGTLVLWDEGQLAVYKEHQEDKGYDVIYSVEPNGRLQPKGVCLFGYQPRRVGLLAEGIYKWMEQTMRWERDALICHFDEYEDIKAANVMNAAPGGNGSGSKRPNGNGNGNGDMVRGQTFSVEMGHNKWHAVYWGKDQIGTIVAHNTNREWSLMHLDLKRFKANLKLGDVLPQAKVEEIEAGLTGSE